MPDSCDSRQTRRQFLKLVGGGAVALPVAGLTGCSGGEDAPAPSAPATEPAEVVTESAPAMPEPEVEVAPEDVSAAAAELPRLDEGDPSATALGYVHDATSVDTAKYPRYASGQLCSNCALYQGSADDEWAGCSIFPGKAVKGTGWCNVYAPKAG